jgi:phosphoinositide-3-kinase, regulatory subunit 4
MLTGILLLKKVLTGFFLLMWVYLNLKKAPYKKVNNIDSSYFSYYFDTERRTCLLAPERLKDEKNKEEELKKVTEEMDIFSTGCVIAQLFLNGNALFNFSQLLEYRNGSNTHFETSLNKIKEEDIREMIKNMLKRDPSER